MRISDWSSDVCSSDLVARPHRIESRTAGLAIRHGCSAFGQCACRTVGKADGGAVSGFVNDHRDFPVLIVNANEGGGEAAGPFFIPFDGADRAGTAFPPIITDPAIAPRLARQILQMRVDCRAEPSSPGIARTENVLGGFAEQDDHSPAA